MQKKENMPDWAYWGLWGINSRKVALAFAIGSLLLCFIIVPYAIKEKIYTFMAFPLVPLWYWLSIKWADKNSAW